MFWHFLQLVFGRRVRNDGLTNDEMDQMDLDHEDGPSLFDCEGVMVEEGEVVGETAIINEKHQLVLTEGRLPKVPKAFIFDRESAELIKAGLCTTLLHVKVSLPEGETLHHFGTAFLIGKKHLITAGHNLYIPERATKKIKIAYPGTSRVNYSQLLDGNIPTIDCTEVRSLYSRGGPWERDIALLHAGSYNAAVVLQPQLPLDLPNLNGDNDAPAIVDVIGYPGDPNTRWLRSQKVNDVDQSIDDVTKLLPRRTLTVTSGVVKTIATTMAYELSTSPGMSGSCVLYKGKVIGVHIGQPTAQGSLPSAVPLTADTLRLLCPRKVFNLITQSP